MNQEKTLEEKLRELSLDDLNKITYKSVNSLYGESNVSKRPEVRAKISAAHKGRAVSDETKAKLSAIAMVRVMSDETKAKISDAGKGRVVSDETKAKLSAINKGKVVGDETKARISALAKQRCKEGKGRPLAKVTEAQVLEIRSKYVPRKYTTTMLAKEYGLGPLAVIRIINRTTWNHI